ncbi:MAG TPA: hypothetical protein VE988_26960 [Gemmataceae bacterium]|nr:hypothetical protein [Gemmataceae bacterium]
MCIEVYSTDQPIQILYESENLRFLSPLSFRGRYILLVRNAGFRPIDLLSVLYPRRLFSATKVASKPQAKIKFRGFTNITERLPEYHNALRIASPNQLEMELPDPNNPLCNLPFLRGYWDHSNIAYELPPRIREKAQRCLWAYNKHHFSAWNFRLSEPIKPGDAHWFQWQFVVEDAGGLLDKTIYGPAVFHEIASPIDVRRTVVENIQNALQDVHKKKQEFDVRTEGDVDNLAILGEHEEAFKAIVQDFGLAQERRVDIQYYELTVETGNPQEQFLMYMLPQGDIRLRSGSPRIGSNKKLDAGRLGEPVYEWKSGSILEPAHPWRNTGFTLRMGLGCTKAFVG